MINNTLAGLMEIRVQGIQRFQQKKNCVELAFVLCSRALNCDREVICRMIKELPNDVEFSVCHPDRSVLGWDKADTKQV